RLPDHENLDITDDQIHEWLLRLMQRTPYITLIFDCCNSGTILREGKVRGLPREERQSCDGVPPTRGRTVYRDTQMGSGSKNWLRDGEGEKCVLFAACRSTEFANEILVGDSPQVPHGALTYFLVQELMSPASRAPHARKSSSASGRGSRGSARTRIHSSRERGTENFLGRQRFSRCLSYRSSPARTTV